MMQQLSRIYNMVRNFLFSSVNKEFLIFLFFLVLSGIFWLMMSLNETYEKEVPVPVRLVNVPRNAIITTDMEDTVRVTVRDKGFVLASYVFGNRPHPLLVNFNNYANKSTGHGTIPLSDVQKQVYQQLSGSSKIISIRPDHLDFYFNYGLSKRVPVRAAGNIIPGRNYYLARTVFSPEMVTIYASKQLLDSIKYLTTENLHIVNFEDTVITEVALKKIRGVKCVPSSVHMILYPDVLTEESVEVPVEAIHMPKDKVLRTFPSRVKVKFIVGASMFRLVKPEHFSVVADYNELSVHPSDKCNIYLRTFPHGVTKPHLEVQQVDYLIEQQ